MAGWYAKYKKKNKKNKPFELMCTCDKAIIFVHTRTCIDSAKMCAKIFFLVSGTPFAFFASPFVVHKTNSSVHNVHVTHAITMDRNRSIQYIFFVVPVKWVISNTHSSDSNSSDSNSSAGSEALVIRKF